MDRGAWTGKSDARARAPPKTILCVIQVGIDACAKHREVRRLMSRTRERIGTSVRTRILAIALIPSAVLFLSGAAVVAALGIQAYSVKQWSDHRARSIDPLVGFITAVQSERMASMAALTATPAAQAELWVSRGNTDSAIQETARIAADAQDIDDGTGAESIRELGDLLARIPAVRDSIDRGEATAEAIDRYYSALLDATMDAGDDSARFKSSDIATMDAELTAMALVRAAENHSRVVALVTGAAGRALSEPQRRFLAQAVGVYRQQIDAVGPRLAPKVREGLRTLTDGAQWRFALAGEDEIAERGVMAIPEDQWLAAERAIDTRLNALTRDEFRVSVAMTQDAASRLLGQLGLATAVMVLVTGLAVAASLGVANRLLRRLRALRTASLDLARTTLPAIVDRIHQGEPVDTAAETEVVDRGTDEIGQVAEAFALAQRTAIDTAVAEARTREGFNKVFLDIAFRSQALVRRQLDVLDVAEARQDDPEDLELLFQLDHLATRARRNAENLLILGGRRPGRRWRDPVALEDIVRSAVSETEGYARVSTVRLPSVRVLGAVVADLIHMLAELIDNATTFSPPDAPVTVHGNTVGRGVVVEVEDQGLGLGFDDRARLNLLLAQPPQFHDMALAGERHLGLFVVSRLAGRHGVTVSLQESAYGGVKAIVLLSWALLERTSATAVVGPASAASVPDELSGTGRAPALPTGRNGRTAPMAPAARPSPPGRPPLPRRDRLSHLAPQLRHPSVETPATAERSGPSRVRAPGSVRAAMTSLQRGTRRARQGAQHPDH